MQYYDTGYLQILFVVVLVGFLLFNIRRARKGKALFIRRIPGLNAIEEAVGRATEMGRPILMVPGLSGLDPVGIQAINIFGKIASTSAKYGTPIRLCVADPALFSVAEEVMREAYQAEGYGDSYDPKSVVFISDRQMAFAAGVVGVILREKAAACFLMGAWTAESLILAETANEVGAIQVAASTFTTQTPFLIAACDYVLIGDEFYAASAYLAPEPVLVGSLVGQDWSKILIALIVFVFVIQGSIEKAFIPQTYKDSQVGEGRVWTRQPTAPHLKKRGDLLERRLFYPHPTEELNPKRQKRTLAPWEKDDSGGDS